MLKLISTILLAALALCPLLHAADDPALDAAKYPQDTPQKAIESIIKALDAKDFAYYVTHLILPADRERLLKKYGTAENYAAAKSEAAQVAAMQAMSDVLKGLQKDSKLSEGEAGGAKWTRFESKKERLQLEKVADGRWAMNLKPPGEVPRK